MSLKDLLKSTLPQFPVVREDNEIEILHELPVETLFLSLKSADDQAIAWFYENALPEQIQGVADLDLWNGDQFLPERWDDFFRSLVGVHPVKLGNLMKSLDPEVIVRGLLDFVDVLDHDPQNPPETEDADWMLSPDNKYVLVLKRHNPQDREILQQWMNRLAAADLEHLRRLLESCKWEQPSDLEEFGYRMKKGRLEDHGFVDRGDAIAIYARGNAADHKKYLLENVLPEGAKSVTMGSPETDGEFSETINESFLPAALSRPLHGEGWLAEGLRGLQKSTNEIVLAESLRAINMALAADEVFHGSLEDLGTAALRARRYIDLGLVYLSDAKKESVPSILEHQPVAQIMRLGWLVLQDLSRVASEILRRYPVQAFGVQDEAILKTLRTRHPELSPEGRADLGITTDTIVTMDAVLAVGRRLTHINRVAEFVTKDLAAGLSLKDKPLGPIESLYSRLLSGLVREMATGEFKAGPFSVAEWERISGSFQGDFEAKIRNNFMLVAGKVPEASRAFFVARFESVLGELLNFVKAKQGGGRPDVRFFRALAFEPISAD